jgi:hypothetical protein
VFVQSYIIDLKSLFSAVIDSIISGLSPDTNSGSLNARFQVWELGSEYFNNANPLIGVGFGRLHNIHNVYLQIIFELGLLGTFLFLFTVFFIKKSLNDSKQVISQSISIKHVLLTKVKNLAILHVLWFATNNHNLNHHLTWFCVFLVFISNYKFLKTNKLKNIER